ncbi:MAG TPA: Sir2 family NAD-dependent protein deacetylase [Acidimicrobiia bacterium]|nr:Sir2 family NAD-dependent protein deacetylase [Acidimicrobiia bacterium]
MEDALHAAGKLLKGSGKILAFTGAGISTESGIPDFRGPNGVWTKVDPDDFHISRYLTNPEVRRRGWKLHQSGELWGARSTVRPNSGHEAIVDLWEAGRLAGCVTQNIDGLHLEAGLPSEAVAELHGSTRAARCMSCSATWPTETVLVWMDEGMETPECPHCRGIVKTTTVLFGETLPDEEVSRAWKMAEEAEAVLAIGSTLSVWPAAEIPYQMAVTAKPLIIVNQGATDLDHLASIRIEGAAGQALPALVKLILSPD